MEEETGPKPAWDISKTHPQFQDDLEEGLSGITDPELGFSILELGLVRNIRIEDDEVMVTMILTSPFCPYGPAMLESARAEVVKILGMRTNIELGSEIWDQSMMDKDLMDPGWGLYP